MKFMNDINFIKPIPPKKQEELIRWYTRSLLASGILMIMLTGTTIYQVYKLIKLKQHQKQLQQTQSAFTKEQEKLSILQKTHESLEKRIKKIESITDNPKNPALFLEELSKLIPPDVALAQYKQQHKMIELEGQALATQSVMNFLQALNQSQHFKEMQIRSMQQDTQNADGQSLVRFVIKGNIKI